jgi:hypothetical protein
MHPMDVVVDEVMAELENGMTNHPDPIMALADCVGVVLLHWDSLDMTERRELLERVDQTVRNLEERLVAH